MSEQLYHLAARAVATCPDHAHLQGPEFANTVRAVVREAHAKQSAPPLLLPTRMTKEIQ